MTMTDPDTDPPVGPWTIRDDWEGSAMNAKAKAMREFAAWTYQCSTLREVRIEALARAREYEEDSGSDESERQTLVTETLQIAAEELRAIGHESAATILEQSAREVSRGELPTPTADESTDCYCTHHEDAHVKRDDGTRGSCVRCLCERYESFDGDPA